MDHDLKWLREKIEKRKTSSKAIGVQLSLAHAERLAERIEDLEFMRGIATDMHAMMSSRVQVPEGMLQAFADAIAYEHPKQSKNGRKGDG